MEPMTVEAPHHTATGEDLAETLAECVDQYEAAVVVLADADRTYEQAWNAAHRALFKAEGRQAAFNALGGVHPEAVRGAVVGRMRQLGLEMLLKVHASGDVGADWRSDLRKRLGRRPAPKE